MRWAQVALNQPLALVQRTPSSTPSQVPHSMVDLDSGGFLTSF
jgi:hypothetical protein